MRHIAVLLVLMAALGCGREQEVPPPPDPATASPVSEAQPTTEPPAAVVAHVTAVDLEGKPIAGLMPIATRQPNAFDAPVASGQLTGADGHAHAHLPVGERLYVRVWDPALRLFPSNYYEVLPAAGTETEEMRIVMAPASNLRAKIQSPGGAPLANATVDLQLHHIKEGPWWPARATTDQVGAVHFDNLPPGNYGVELWSGHVGNIQVPGIDLPPKGSTDLGVVRLIAP